MTISATTLEGAIRELAERGEISDLGLSMSQDGKAWRASYVMCSRFGVSYAEDEDPVKALILAMSTAKLAPRAKVTKPTSLDLVAESSVDRDPTHDADDLM